MKQEDEATSVTILNMINETIDEAIDEAIGTAEVQDSLRRATGYDRGSYNAVVKSLHKGVRSNLKTQFTSSNSDEAARYAAAIREALNQLREYVNSFPDYQTLWSREEDVLRQGRQKTELRKQLDKQRSQAEFDEVLAKARETLSLQERPSRKPFWKANRLTESGKLDREIASLDREIASLDEELTQMRSKFTDTETERKQFELRVWPMEPNYAQQCQKVADARRTLFTFALEASLPSLRTSIQEYAANPTHFDKEPTPANADLPSDSGSTLSDSDPDSSQETDGP